MGMENIVPCKFDKICYLCELEYDYNTSIKYYLVTKCI